MAGNRQGGTGKDFEEETQAVACQSRHGHRILEAASGLEAERARHEHGGRIDLRQTDIVMPEGVSGRELAQLLCRSDPDLKVIYSGRYSPGRALPEETESQDEQNEEEQQVEPQEKQCDPRGPRHLHRRHRSLTP